ncbi:acyltransferase family protein [Cellvibrio sp. OA-2007]|uniref:acyltransferase family protein n=1 Tax=Cellvibrio sp. OA-2007 TaxID=529823 RepID=UPI000780556F|nr:acyltransferase family protein [Cellvibrio sp. OA-2007]
MLQGRELSDSRFQIDALDGLRGLAVLMVFVSHASKNNMDLLPGFDFSGIGKGGVYLFFLLSSFLLTLPFLEKGKSAFAIRPMVNYGVRRFFRIYPLFVFYLLSCVLGTWLVAYFDIYTPLGGIPFALNWSDFFAHLLLQKGYSVTWSIPVEFRYYFVLPLVAALYVFIARARLWLALIISAVLIAGTQVFWHTR